MTDRAFNKMVAVNTWNANHNIMRDLESKGETNTIMYISLKREQERLEKRYPSLRWIISLWLDSEGSTN